MIKPASSIPKSPSLSSEKFSSPSLDPEDAIDTAYTPMLYIEDASTDKRTRTSLDPEDAIVSASSIPSLDPEDAIVTASSIQISRFQNHNDLRSEYSEEVEMEEGEARISPMKRKTDEMESFQSKKRFGPPEDFFNLDGLNGQIAQMECEENHILDWSSPDTPHPFDLLNYNPDDHDCPLKVDPTCSWLRGSGKTSDLAVWSRDKIGMQWINHYYNIIESYQLYVIKQKDRSGAVRSQKDRDFKEYLLKKETDAYSNLIKRIAKQQYKGVLPYQQVQLNLPPMTNYELLVSKVEEKDFEWITDKSVRKNLDYDHMLDKPGKDGKTPFYIWALQASSKILLPEYGKKKQKNQEKNRTIWRQLMKKFNCLLPRNRNVAYTVLERRDVSGFSPIFCLVAGCVRGDLALKSYYRTPSKFNFLKETMDPITSTPVVRELIGNWKELQHTTADDGFTCFHQLAMNWRCGPKSMESKLHSYRWIESEIPGFIESPDDSNQPIEIDYVTFYLIILKLKRVATLKIREENSYGKTGIDILRSREDSIAIGKDFDKLIHALMQLD